MYKWAARAGKVSDPGLKSDGLRQQSRRFPSRFPRLGHWKNVLPLDLRAVSLARGSSAVEGGHFTVQHGFPTVTKPRRQASEQRSPDAAYGFGPQHLPKG